MERETINEYFHEFDEAMKKGNFDEAKTNLQLLELHVRHMESDHKKWVQDEIISCRSQLTRQQLLAMEKLLSGQIQSPADSRVTALDLLVEARQKLAESEEVCTETLRELQEQRHKLERVKSNLKETGDDLNNSNKVLNRMSSFWRR